MTDTDRIMAEKVMGWKYFESITDFVDPSYCETKDGIHFTFIVYEHGWHPSTDISQAFEVVEKMRELPSEKRVSFFNALIHIVFKRLAPKVTVSYMVNNCDWFFNLKPEDICLAAEKGMEVKP